MAGLNGPLLQEIHKCNPGFGCQSEFSTGDPTESPLQVGISWTSVELHLLALGLNMTLNTNFFSLCAMGPHPRSTHDLHTAFPEAKEKLLSSNSLVKILYITCMSEWQYCTNGCTFVIFVKKKRNKKDDKRK